MKLYDKIINECLMVLENSDCFVRLNDDKDIPWELEKEQKIIFQKDMYYELGGAGLPAVSGIAFTSNIDFEDSIYLCGDNLNEIKEDCPYARITILNVDDSAWLDNQKAYNAMQRIDYTRYHVYPKGFMMRISTAAGREPVRISRDAIKAGLNFQKVGKLFIDAYHKHSEVKAVKIIFITERNFPYSKLIEKTDRMEDITKSLDKIYNNLVMDCRSCNLKTVCDEVEGMRELHETAVNK